MQHDNELAILKEIYLKPIHIYIPTPIFVYNMRKHSNKSMLHPHINMEEYKNNFISIQSAVNNCEK